METAFRKDYDGWHVRKRQLNERLVVARYFYEREIWWTAIGVNVGFEQDGKHDEYTRPVVILRKFNARLFLGIPLSTTGRRGRYYFPFRYVVGRESVAVISQMRAYDSRRLVSKSGVMQKQDFAGLRKIVVRMLMRKWPEK
ncbi:MAG: type II toxin-antitoxin system PemK/MazF family toxin [bacterium]|nr:type II toxin-antitoxin system PemK/MazF family toxin [bacterium]MDZ4247814.1 type II toxin-antitoxin system PemK/MazF family toxin [Patescibacteria group bacterium]